MKLWHKTGAIGLTLACIGMALEHYQPWEIGKIYTYNNFYITLPLFALCILCFTIGLDIGESHESLGSAA